MSAATLSSAAVTDGTATVPSREWWRREAAREGSDWRYMRIPKLTIIITPLPASAANGK